MEILIRGTTVDDIISRVPAYAERRELIPVKGKVEAGFEYKWIQNEETWRVRVHGPDPTAIGSNARNNWIVRVQKGKKSLDSNGNWHTGGIYKKESPYYSEEIINDTHIPIQALRRII
ncbi:polymorphic toxin type 30 domain-containing protein [Brevibacillus fortis]|uniref:polymorphic toxin type 30 domain-containing protein n=1 Tax=Brevibacillus fortis TaxID=2126352 RepID=UPI002E207B98|nr:polymorphic toxin type 30 domain-containing protein [Brevibacillus fortis]